MKSHRTRQELEQREKAEKSLETGQGFEERDEIKNNKVAHKEFIRLKTILAKINKDDALYEATINRYCLLTAECFEFKKKQKTILTTLVDLNKKYKKSEIEAETYYSNLNKLEQMVLSIDRQLMSKRKMLFDIEKENIMTIASALRSIPKKVEEKEEEDPMAKLLGRKRA